MNARQAAKAAAERIKELEYANRLYQVDVKAYNAVICGTAEGKTICEWCEWYQDENHCDPEKRGKQGCTDWGLMFNVQEVNEDEEQADAGAGADPAGAVDCAGGGFMVEGRGYDLGDMSARVISEHPGQAERTE